MIRAVCSGIQTLPSRRSDERGITLVFIALILFAAFGLAAMVVDHAKEEVAVGQIQRTADAAALAAARELNGQVSGWWNAKKAALAVLRSNPIHGVTPHAEQSLQLVSGSRSYWDDSNRAVVRHMLADSDHRDAVSPASNPGSEGASGNLKVKVTRGVYWRRGAGVSANGYTFIPLESDDAVKRGTGMNSFLVANAVRVEVTVEDFATTLGSVFQMRSFGNLVRSSIAVMDQDTEFDSVGLAIPLCNVLYDGRPTVMTGDRERGKLDMRLQCERQGVATELGARAASSQLHIPGAPGPHSSTPIPVVSDKERRDGITRAESVQRYPYFYYDGSDNLCFGAGAVGWGRNCIQLPIYGTLGTFSAGIPSRDATAEEVVRTFETPTRVALGDYFAPLNSLAGFADQSLSQRLARTLDNQPTIRNTFMDETVRTVARPNFPYTNVSRPDWSVDAATDPQNRPDTGVSPAQRSEYDLFQPIPGAEADLGLSIQVQLIRQDWAVDPANPGAPRGWQDYQTYSNIMAHFPSSNTVANSPDVGRARTVWAALIVPSVDHYPEDEETLVRFCAWDKMISQGTSTGHDAAAPSLDAKSQVAGMIKVSYYDFRFDKLPQTPDFGPEGGRLFVDRNPARLRTIMGNKLADPEDYEQSYQSYYECLQHDHSSHPDCDPPAGLNGDGLVPSQWWLEKCFNFSTYNGLRKVMQDFDKLGISQHRDGSAWELLRAFKHYSGMLRREGIPAKQQYEDGYAPHCLPEMKDWRMNPNSSSSYYPPDELKSGVGWGGVVFRLGCGGSDVSTITGKPWAENSPALVANVPPSS